MKKLVFATLTAALLLGINPIHAYPAVGQIRQQALQDMHDSWDSSDSTKTKTAKFGFYINAYRDVVNVRVKESSGDLQFDAECAEAVISHRPLLITESRMGGAYREAEIVFSSPAKYAGDDIKKYRQKKHLGKDIVLVHIIPLSVVQLFPGLFKTEELLSESNLHEISANKFDIDAPEIGFLKELTRMYAGLGKLYDKKNLTRTDILRVLEKQP